MELGGVEMAVLGDPVLEMPVEAVPVEELRVEVVPVEALPVEDWLREVLEGPILEALVVPMPELGRVLDELDVELRVKDPGPVHGGGETGEGQAVMVVLTTKVSTLSEQPAGGSLSRRSTSTLAAMPESRTETASSD